MNRHARKELKEIYEEIGKLRHVYFPEGGDHEYIDTCLIYKMLQKRGNVHAPLS